MIIAISGKIGSGKDTVGKIIQYLTSQSKDIMSYEEYQTSQSKYRYEPAFEIHKFADKLKDMVCLLIGCTREQLEDQDFKNKELGEEWDRLVGRKGWYKNDERITQWEKLTPRKLLQLLGTECGRDIIHTNIWINSLFVDYKWDYETERAIQHGKIPREEILLNKFPKWIITDMRFPNELEAVKARNGITIRVNTDNKIYMNIKNEKLWAERDKLFKGKEHESETALDNAEFDYTIDNNGTIEELIDKVKEILIKEKLL